MVLMSVVTGKLQPRDEGVSVQAQSLAAFIFTGNGLSRRFHAFILEEMERLAAKGVYLPCATCWRAGHGLRLSTQP